MRVNRQVMTHLTKEMLQGHGGLPCQGGAAAGGIYRQALFLHDGPVGCLQGQLAPPGLIIEGCQRWPCPPVTLQMHCTVGTIFKALFEAPKGGV